MKSKFGKGREVGLNELGLREGVHAALGGVEEAQDVAGHQLGMGIAKGVRGGGGVGLAVGVEGSQYEMHKGVRSGLVVSTGGAFGNVVMGVVGFDAGAHVGEGGVEGVASEVS